MCEFIQNPRKRPKQIRAEEARTLVHSSSPNCERKERGFRERELLQGQVRDAERLGRRALRAIGADHADGELHDTLCLAREEVPREGQVHVVRGRVVGVVDRDVSVRESFRVEFGFG